MQTETETTQLPPVASKPFGDAAQDFPQQPPAERWFERPTVLLRAILALTFAAYLQTIGFAFVSDDWHLIPSNPWMESWRSVPRFFTDQMWAFSPFHFDANFYRPVFMLWLFLIGHATGGAPAWFHLATVLLHVVAVAEVFVLARSLTGDATVSLLAALIFGLHPAKVEAVAWISGMTELLCAVFFFGAMISWLRWGGSRRKSWLIATLACLSLALLSKENAILAPLLFSIYEWHAADGGLADRARAVFARVWMFFALAGAYLLWRVHVMHGLSESSVLHPSVTTLLHAISAFLWYVRHLVWPVGLSSLYDPSPVGNPAPVSLFLPIFASVLGAVVIYRSTSNPGARALLLWWFPVLIAPVAASFAILQMHDRYLYLPSFTFAVALACALSGKWIRGRSMPRAPRVALTAALTAALLAGTLTESKWWSDDVSLAQRGVQISPSFPLVYCALAAVYLDNGREQEAHRIAQETTERFPKWIQGWEILGRADYIDGNLDAARFAFTQALGTPYAPARKDMALYSLGLIAQRQGDLPAAEAWYRRSLAANPTSKGAQQALAAVLAVGAPKREPGGPSQRGLR